MCELAALALYEWGILCDVAQDPDGMLGLPSTGIREEDVVELTLKRPDALLVCRECGGHGVA